MALTSRTTPKKYNSGCTLLSPGGIAYLSIKEVEYFIRQQLSM